MLPPYFLDKIWAFTKCHHEDFYFHRTRVRSLAMLVTHSFTHSLTDSLTNSLLFSILD